MSLLPIMMWLNIPSLLLEKDKRSYDDVLAASGVGGRGRVGTGRMERPARDGAVGHRVIAFEHRDLGGLLLGKPVPLVVWTVGEAGGLADAVVVDPVVVDVGLVGEGGPGAEHKGKHSPEAELVRVAIGTVPRSAQLVTNTPVRPTYSEWL